SVLGRRFRPKALPQCLLSPGAAAERTCRDKKSVSRVQRQADCIGVDTISNATRLTRIRIREERRSVMIGEQKTPHDPKKRDDLHGGTEHLDVIPTVGEDLASGGTPATAAPSGGVHPPPPGKSGPPMTG